MSKKQPQAMLFSYFLRTGMKLFRKATGRGFDISTLVKSDFSKKTLAKHNYGIYTDPLHFREKDEVTNEVTSMLLSTPSDPYYPEINPKSTERWLAMFGIKPQQTRFGYVGGLLLYYRYLAKVIWRLVRDTVQSVRQANKGASLSGTPIYDTKTWLIKSVTKRGTFKGTPIHDKVNNLLSRSIANRYGHDKGKHRNPEKHGKDDTFQASFTSREIKESTKQRDSAIPSDTAHIESKLMLQQALEMYHRFTPKQQLSVMTMMLSINQGSSWNRAFSINESNFRSLGITTPKGAKKCYDKLDEEYSEWRNIRDSLKQ